MQNKCLFFLYSPIKTLFPRPKTSVFLWSEPHSPHSLSIEFNLLVSSSIFFGLEWLLKLAEFMQKWCDLWLKWIVRCVASFWLNLFKLMWLALIERLVDLFAINLIYRWRINMRWSWTTFSDFSLQWQTISAFLCSISFEINYSKNYRSMSIIVCFSFNLIFVWIRTIVYPIHSENISVER